NPQASFEEVRDKYLEGRDNEVVIHVISPRVFEAAALRVLMILYPGTYSGVAKPGRHYVELLPDHSNMDEVVAILRDPERAGEIIENAYKEIACSPTWTYKSFIEHFDEVLDQEMQPMEGRLASGKPIASAEWEAEQRAEYERRQVVKLAEFKRLEVSNSQGVQKLQKRMQFVLLLNKARVVSYEFIDKKMPAVISRPVLRMAQGASRKIKPLLRKLLLRA
ncbi:MAG: glycosyltransferase, partial [Hyphomicrobiaceae bacterium]|nr:glycosyltransferase [Hyphomicrobiaceae bacterium]